MNNPNRINLFIVYELGRWSQDWNVDFTEKYFLFGVVKLTKNGDGDEDSYSGYSIGFDSRSHFSYLNFDCGKNVVIFGVDNSSSQYIDHKEKYLLVLAEGLIKELQNAAITEKAKYSINFSRS